ncbi:MAG TPA: response regulator [Candidatus Binatus sp.]|uniref:hybrid sensor histidine kinase/response regulator n=1 Tax=Candidatus Binatus sp. TaxID=2811406 RepID=UPI002B472D2F|nr:response regulator [Candidatus Binatus sp.]HKN11903.1 response regulator [Candidatus Binatus sp.]
MSQPRRVLIVEDSPDDAELTVRALRRGACFLTYHRVDTPEAMRRALEEQNWDIVIADYSMPRFTGLAALKMLQKAGLDVPFILVSGTVGEEVAVEAMKCGADDYVLKSNLARLPLAVERELRDYEVRAERNRAEARYRSLADRVPVELFRISPEGDLLEFNPTLIEMLGFQAGSSPTRVNLAEVWLRQEERVRLKAIIDQVGVVKNFEMEIRRPDGSVIWCEQSARAVYDAAGKVAHYEGVLVDITYRKRAEDEANRARDRVRDLALETARMRSEFLASMSHEIRTPLAGIIGTGELLSRSDLTAEQRRLTEIIRSSGELLLTIVNDILDFSKLAAGRVELEKLDFDLVELTENLIDSFAVAARAKGIELALYVDANVPTGLRGDPSRLRQILNNLVANAIKFTERGDVTVRASTVESTAGHALVRFEVVDTGIGIPDEAQARLFQPFVQAEGSTGRRFGGTGLGLVIAAKLIEQMGGEIGFESAPERGSNFHFTARFGRGSEIVHPWMSATAISCFKAMRAMVVDDSPALRQVISEYLTSWGVENAAVGGGAEALAILKRWTAGGERQVVVLIDEQTPDMGALTLARAIKDHFGGRHSKVIMFSAETGGRSASEAVDAWITKPVRPSHLFSCILELCGSTGRVGVEKIAAAPPRPIGNEQPQWRKAVRVLLVDDNLVNRTIGAKQLSALGYTAEIADCAQRGVEIVSSGGCDIVLMDCEMPEMDGYEAVAEIRRREGDARHSVVIALTAHATEDDRARCLDAGMDDYLSKPVKLDALANKVDAWVHRKLDHILTSG